MQTVQLTRREAAALHEKAQEIAASVSSEKETQIQQLSTQVSQLEIALAQKEEVHGCCILCRYLDTALLTCFAACACVSLIVHPINEIGKRGNGRYNLFAGVR
jgi:hypothetical protein